MKIYMAGPARVAETGTRAKSKRVGQPGRKRLLTDAQVLELRALYEFGGWSLSKIRERFGLDVDSAKRYAHGVTRRTVIATPADLPAL